MLMPIIHKLFLINSREPSLKVTLWDNFFDIKFRKLNIVAYAYNHITLELEIGGFQVQQQRGLHKETFSLFSTTHTHQEKTGVEKMLKKDAVVA